MSRDPSLRLEDILEASQCIHDYLDGFDYDSFTHDRRTIDAVTRNLEVVGEAVKHLPEEMTDRFPEIPWKAIAGFRDILAHCYFSGRRVHHLGRCSKPHAAIANRRAEAIGTLK